MNGSGAILEPAKRIGHEKLVRCSRCTIMCFDFVVRARGRIECIGCVELDLRRAQRELARRRR
jgi:hypothetical protein